MKCYSQSESSAQSLLDFMDVASNAVKSALKNPTTFKRNINHRRYLQRQVGKVVRGKRNSRKLKPRELKEDVQDLVREAIKELKHSQRYAGTSGTFRHRGLPTQYIGSDSPTQRFHTNSTLKPCTYRLTHLPLLSPTNTQNHIPPLISCSLYSGITLGSEGINLSLNAENDCSFMTGEELTNNIDINDLYIPELHEPRNPIVKCEDYIVANDL